MLQYSPDRFKVFRKLRHLYPLASPPYPFLFWVACTALKTFFSNSYFSLNFPFGRLLLLTTYSTPNFNHQFGDLARKTHFASNKTRTGIPLDRSAFLHADIPRPPSISAYPLGHISCFFLIIIFKGNKQPKSKETKILLSKSTISF